VSPDFEALSRTAAELFVQVADKAIRDRNQASVLAFIVSGASKAEALMEVLTRQPEAERFPARLIRPDCDGGKLYRLVDKNAASLLKT
jgi:6-phosphogluconolactonase/glucosamine-6-phosphate isomerase/deaminase